MRRLFLRKLKNELRIPVLALVDSDPYGLKILSVYMKGAARQNRTLLQVPYWSTLLCCTSLLQKDRDWP